MGSNVFLYSVIATASALLLLGALRAGVTQRKPFQTISETLLVGGISALVAYVVGTFFRI